MWEYQYPDYLYHHGVKGMKWGVRKANKLSTSDVRNRLDKSKADYKSAKKAYNKAYDKAANYSSAHAVGQFTNKKKIAESDKRWNDAIDKGNAANKAKNAYKQAKTERKEAIKSTYKEINKKTSFGSKLVYNNATRKKAAKYVVDNNMSMTEANKRAKKDAWINTAIATAAIGAVTAAQLYTMR